jgi:hypothetical protein
MIAAVFASFAGSEAAAQSIGTGCNSYYPIRQQGPVCSGPNVGWSLVRPDGVTVCCVAPPRATVGNNTRGTIYGPSQSQRYAAGAALGIEGVQLLAEILNFVFAPGRNSEEQYAPPPPREFAEHRLRLDAERVEAMEAARILNEGGLVHARAGHYLTAFGDFKRAAEMADAVNGPGLQYRENMYAMDAYLQLQEGLALWAEGKQHDAGVAFNKADYLAMRAGRRDISDRITRYKDQLRREIGRLPPNPQRTSSRHCMDVNGRLVCD